MRTDLVSWRIVVSWRLTSLCIRYGVAKPSVWLCRKACKGRQFNGFGSDYPLTLTCFRFGYCSVLENCYVRRFLALRSEGRRSVGEVSQSWSQFRGTVARSRTDLACVLLTRKHCRSSSFRARPLGTPFPSEHAGRFFSPQRPLHVAARACWLDLKIGARFTEAHTGHPGRNLCWPFRLTRVPRKNRVLELRDLKQATENEATSTVARARLRSMRTECWCHRCNPRGQKGTDHA